MKKRILAMICALTMLGSMAPTTAMAAEEDTQPTVEVTDTIQEETIEKEIESDEVLSEEILVDDLPDVSDEVVDEMEVVEAEETEVEQSLGEEVTPLAAGTNLVFIHKDETLTFANTAEVTVYFTPDTSGSYEFTVSWDDMSLGTNPIDLTITDVVWNEEQGCYLDQRDQYSTFGEEFTRSIYCTKGSIYKFSYEVRPEGALVNATTRCTINADDAYKVTEDKFVWTRKYDSLLGKYLDEAIITGYVGNASEVTIPSTIAGYPVVDINDFKCTSWTRVTIPEGVRQMFTRSDLIPNLTWLSIPSTLTLFSCNPSAAKLDVEVAEGSQTFEVRDGIYFCGYGRILYSYMGDDEDVLKIPDGMIGIDMNAFSGNPSIGTMYIPDSVNWVYSLPTSLSEVHIAASTTRMMDECLKNLDHHFNTETGKNEYNVTVYAPLGSSAYQICMKYGIPYVAEGTPSVKYMLSEATKGDVVEIDSYQLNENVTIPEGITLKANTIILPDDSEYTLKVKGTLDVGTLQVGDTRLPKVDTTGTILLQELHWIQDYREADLLTKVSPSNDYALADLEKKDDYGKTSHIIYLWNGLKWTKAPQYKIKFKSNDVDGNGDYMEALSCTNEITYELPANEYSNKGYTFTGWNTKADGTGTAYADKATVKNLTNKDGSVITLYAQWKAKTYNITYNLNGGTNDGANPGTYKITTDTITLKKPTLKYYTFGGWYTDSECTGTKVTTIPKGSTGNKTLYAKWKINKYAIQFDGNGATSGSMSNMTSCKYNTTYALTANAYKRTGYKFKGWNTKADGSGTSYANKEEVQGLSEKNGVTVILYAQWSKQKYTITYNLNNGTNSADNPANYTVTTADITLKNPTRKGYTFCGWYTNSECTGTKVTTIPKGSTGNKTLYAKWMVNKYTIKFNGNGSTSGSMSNMASCKYNSTYMLTANAYKRTGYKFKGWNTKADGSGISYANKAEVQKLSAKNGATVTLYAQWSKQKYTITYTLNGGTNHSKNPASYYVTTADVILKKPTKEGYVFKGWYSDSTFKTKVTMIPQGSTGNKILYAKWAK